MATGKVKRIGINQPFDNMMQIPSNANLNNYTAVGIYGCENGSTASSLLNSPTTAAFTMMVFAADGSIADNLTTGKTQVIFGQNAIFLRRGTSAGWNASWYKTTMTTL